MAGSFLKDYYTDSSGVPRSDSRKRYRYLRIQECDEGKGPEGLGDEDVGDLAVDAECLAELGLVGGLAYVRLYKNTFGHRRCVFIVVNGRWGGRSCRRHRERTREGVWSGVSDGNRRKKNHTNKLSPRPRLLGGGDGG